MVRFWTYVPFIVIAFGCTSFAEAQQRTRSSSRPRESLRRESVRSEQPRQRAVKRSAPQRRVTEPAPSSDREKRVRSVSRPRLVRQDNYEELPAPVIERSGSVGRPPMAMYEDGPFIDEHFGGTGPQTGCSCGPRCEPACCCRCVRCRCRFFAFGDYLVWRPRGFDVGYAVLMDSQQPDARQIGPVRTVRGEYNSGYRAGIGMFLSKCSSIQVVFTGLESSDSDSITHPTDADDPNIRLHGFGIDQKFGGVGVFENWDLAVASLDLEMQTLDIEYRWRKSCCVDAFAGARLARLDQEYRGEYTQFDTTNGFRNVMTDIEFNGAGLRFGMEAQRSLICGWSAYGRWAANLLAGDFDADLLQVSDDPLPAGQQFERQTSISQCEIVPIVEFEIGLQWQCGRWTVAAGYSVNAWFNVLTTDDFLAAVQANNFVDLGGDTVYFDGGNVRIGTQF